VLVDSVVRNRDLSRAKQYLSILWINSLGAFYIFGSLFDLSQ
jgi:hypothetical protein